jgi:dTDP-4-dehydrorhamnose 3,5-epimerase-like enzyme
MIDLSSPHLTLQDLNSAAQDTLGLEDYSKKSLEGVQKIALPAFPNDQGDFSELARLNEMGELQAVPGFKLRQINRSTIFTGAIKAWHLHFKQNEIWCVAPAFSLTVGLYDARQNSATQGQSLKVTIGGGKAELLLIPKGVAHGFMNVSGETVQLIYLVDQQFNLEDPDERRLPWDFLGAEFWTPEKN